MSHSAKKFFTVVFYGLIGVISAVSLFIVYDFLLTRTSSITTLITNTKDTPFYLWFYAISTLVALVLFGVDVVITVYLIRRTQTTKVKEQGGTFLGTLVGAFAASCPVCSGLLLSLVGITGGLSAFPFKGLELKTLSIALLIIPLIFLVRRFKNPHCDGRCPVLKDAGFRKSDKLLLFSLSIFLVAELLLTASFLKSEPVVMNLLSKNNTYSPSSQVDSKYAQLNKEVSSQVVPEKGIQTKIVLGNVIPLMLSYGILDPDKLKVSYKDQGGIPQDIQRLLNGPSNAPLLITSKNQFFLVTLLWPVGLSNKLAVNEKSPVSGKDLFNFASTGGWTLGKEQNGGSYFNKYTLIPLTPQQEEKVKSLADTIYRPCCNNSTFFQDCNHGSAALGLIELGVSEGLSDDEIYKDVLAFNSYWFPQNYLETALYFKIAKNMDWNMVDPKLVLSQTYSSISGWQLIDAYVSKIPGLLPKQQGGGSCGV